MLSTGTARPTSPRLTANRLEVLPETLRSVAAAIEAEEHESASSAAAQRVTQLRAPIEFLTVEATDAASSGDEEALAAARDRLHSKRVELRAAKAEAQAQSAPQRSTLTDAFGDEFSPEAVEARWREMETLERRAIVEALVERIEVTPMPPLTDGGRPRMNPERVRVVPRD